MIISAKKIRPYVKVLLWVALLAAAAYLYLFGQNEFYPALTGTETVTALQLNYAAQTINVNQFNTLLQNYSQKTATSSTAGFVADPFR